MTQGNEHLQACKNLLLQANVSYAQHEKGRREPFNLFTALRIENDEVGLHSLFLATLLNHRKAPGEPRENLKHFLETVARHWEGEVENAGHEVLKAIIEKSDFKSDSIQVEPESGRIDILITNNDAESSWAVAIENKIGAGDQRQQLWRYYNSLKGYEKVIMLYLSLDGHEPSEDSIYDEGKCKHVPQNKLHLISYRDSLPSWLEGCRQRACDEPELRESIAQYLHLARKLTGTDQGREYMSELKDLLEEGNNLVLAHDLSEAMIKAKASLLNKLFEAIQKALNSKLEQDGTSRQLQLYSIRLETAIEEQLRKSRNTEFSTGWRLGGNYKEAALAVGGNILGRKEKIYVGIICWKGHETEHNALKDNLKLEGKGWENHYNWVWARETSYGFGTREQIEMLSQGKEKLAENIAQELCEIWKKAHEL